VMSVSADGLGIVFGCLTIKLKNLPSLATFKSATDGDDAGADDKESGDHGYDVDVYPNRRRRRRRRLAVTGLRLDGRRSMVTAGVDT